MVKGVGIYTGNFIPPTNLLALTQTANSNGSPSAAITSGQTVMLTLQSSPAVDSAYATVLTNTATVTYTTTAIYAPVQSAVALGGGGGGAFTISQVVGASGGSGGGGSTDTGFGPGLSTQFSTYGYGYGNAGGTGMAYTNNVLTGGGGGGGAGVAGTSPSVTTTSATTLGSFYLNGTSQYLTAATGSNSSFEANIDFTVEAWIYLSSYNSATITGAGLIGTSGASTASGWYINVGQDANTLRLTSDATGTWADNLSVTTGNGISLNTWTHIALCRNGSNIRLFKNGQIVASSASANTWSFTTPQGVAYIGGPTVGTYTRYLNGYVTNLRIIKGTALYTNTFTPSTIPLTAVTNTTLLLNVSSNDTYITDSSSNNYTITNANSTPYVLFTPFTNTASTSIDPGTGGINTVGTGGVGTIIGTAGQGGMGNNTYSSWLQAVSKGEAIVKGGGIAFNGTSNQYLLVQHGTTLNFPAAATAGTDFTIECWVYLNAHTAGSPCVFANHSSSGTGAIALFAGHGSILFGNTGTSTNKWGIYTPTTGTWTIIGNSANGTDIVYNTWHHLAITRQGSGTNNAKFYLNGQLEAQATWTVIVGPSITTWWISASGDGTNGTQLNGTVSNFRVTGSAVYTGPFTPPTSTLERVQAAGTNITAINDVGKTYSVQFSGTNQYIYANNTQFNLSTDFTVEGWFYPTSFATAMNFFDTLPIGGTATRATSFVLRTVITTGTVSFFSNSVTTTTTAALTVNSWNHIAVTRIGTTIKIYINGIASATITGNSTSFTGGSILVGTNADAVTGTAGFIGYISNVRVVNGLGVYVGDFTVPTTTLTATQASPGRNILGITTNQTVFLGLQNSSHTESTGFAVNLTPINLSLPTLTQTPFKSVVRFLMNTSDLVDYSSNIIPISIGTGGAARSASSPFSSPITNYYICGGGSGGAGTFYSFGGAGGGGTGAGISEAGTAGLANTGGGGGGGGGFSGTSAVSGAGGSGISIIRYSGTLPDAAVTTGSPIGPVTSGNYKYYVFTGTGSLIFSSLIPVEYLVVAGGGGGGGGQGGGGGAGGLLTGSSLQLSNTQTHTVTVGGGGAGGASGGSAATMYKGTNGNNSVLSSITAYGGGGGGSAGSSTASNAIGLDGGSGGGGGNGSATTTGGAGNTPATTPSQGYTGGAGLSGSFDSGGGGGAGAVGNPATAGNGGNGGTGVASSITGTSVTYAGGGGGTGNSTVGAGGTGGGGAGGRNTPIIGTVNTGGGGGGGRDATGATGGSGIVVIAYPNTYPNLVTVTGTLTINGSANNTVPDTASRPGYKIYKFTAGTGTIRWY